MDYGIHDAAADGDLHWLEDLVRNDPSLVNSEDLDQLTPLYYAITGGHKDVAEFLISKGADICVRTPLDNRTLLHWAAFYRHLDVAEVLLKNGIEVNARDDEDETPLHLALANEDRLLIELLQKYGAVE